MSIQPNILCVCATIIPLDDGYVFVKEGQDHLKGKWNLPAGRIEPGETPQECAIREAKEEAGLNVTLDGLVGVYFNPTQEIVVFVFLGQPETHDLDPETNEIETAQVYSIDEISTLNFRGNWIKKAISDYLESDTYPTTSVLQIYE